MGQEACGMTDKYILNGDGKTPILCTDIERWARFMEHYKRTLAKDTCSHKNFEGTADVSTVFLGIDHNFTGKGDPVLFETMIFGGPADGECKRATTWANALKNHADACGYIKAGYPGIESPDEPDQENPES
jgi:hypothetical protein